MCGQRREDVRLEIGMNRSPERLSSVWMRFLDGVPERRDCGTCPGAVVERGGLKVVRAVGWERDNNPRRRTR